MPKTQPHEWMQYIERDRPISIRNAIARNNERLIWALVKKHPHPDDLFQVGYIGLLKAVETYDPHKGRAFSTFATACIRGELLHYFRGNRHGITGLRSAQERIASVQAIARRLQKREEPVDLDTIALNLMAPQRWQEAQRDAIAIVAIELNEETVAVEPPQFSELDVQGLREAIAVLPSLTQDIVIDHWYEGLSLRAIARRRNIAYREARQILDAALEQLREQLSRPTVFREPVVEVSATP